MSEQSFAERTEAPTQRRRDEARNKGQIARSQELNIAIQLLVGAMVLHVAGASIARGMTQIFGASTRIAGGLPDNPDAVAAMLRGLGWQMLAATAPALLAMAVAAGAMGALQAGGVLTTKPLEADWNRISPANNIKRLFGLRSVVDLLKSLLKLAVVGFAMYGVLRRAWPDIVTLAQQSPHSLLNVAQHYSVQLLATAGGAYLLLAGADYGHQLWTHHKNLRMTKDEVKRELKEMEGDPLLKSRLRSMGRSLVRKRMFREVPNADVVVTNPTHVAVALKYDPEIAPAPIVLAMGERKVAQRIKKLALESGVPVVENKPLARALLATARIGLPVPTELYLAVAEVLAFVIRQRTARGMAWQGSALA